MAGSPMRRKRYKATRTPTKPADSSVAEKPTADAQATGEIKAVLDQEAKAADVDTAVNGEVKAAEVESATPHEVNTTAVHPAIDDKVKTAEVEPAVNHEVKTTEAEPNVSHDVETAKIEPAVNREVDGAEVKPVVDHEVKTAEVEPTVSHEVETANVEPADVEPANVEPANVKPALDREVNTVEVKPAVNHEAKTADFEPVVNHELKITKVQPAINHEVKTALEPAVNHKFQASNAKPVLKRTISVSPDDCVPAAKNTRKPPSRPHAPPENGAKAKTEVSSGRSAYEKFKSGEPDPPIVTDILRRLEASKQSNAAFQKNKTTKTLNVNKNPTAAAPASLSGFKSSGQGAKRKRAHSPINGACDGDIGEEHLAQFGTNIDRDGQWWVEPIIGEAFPKRPEYSTWCQAGDQCLGLRDFHCLLRHKYQEDYWSARKVNLSSLPADPDGLGSQGPPRKRVDKRLKAPDRFYQFTGALKGAATGKHWALHRRRR